MAYGIAIENDDPTGDLPVGPSIYKTAGEARDDVQAITNGASAPSPLSAKREDFGDPISYGVSLPAANAPATPPAAPAPVKSVDPRFGDPIQYGAPAAPAAAPDNSSWVTKLSKKVDPAITRLFGDNPAPKDEIDQAGLAAQKQDEAADQSDIAARRKELGTDDPGRWFARKMFDAIQSGEGNIVGELVQYIGNLSDHKGLVEYGDALKRESAARAPTDDSVILKIANGLGSMAPLYVAGLGIGAGATVLGVGSAAANTIAAGSAALLETATVAQETHDNVMQETGNKELAERQSLIAAVLNLPLTFVTDKLGVFGESGSALKKLAMSLGMEGVQEGSQQLLSNWLGYKPLGEGVTENAVVGGLAGGAVKGAHMALQHWAEQTTPDDRKNIIDTIHDEGLKAREEVFNKLMDDERTRSILQGWNIESADDPRFDRVATSIAKLDQQLAETGVHREANRAETTKQRGEDVRAAFGETASTGYGIGTSAQEPVMRRDSIQVEDGKIVDGQPVTLPEDRSGNSGAAMAPEDLVARQQGFEISPAFHVGTQSVANRFVTQSQAETFLFGPMVDGKRSGGYAESVPDQDFQIRSGVRPKSQGGGTFYFVEARAKSSPTSEASSPTTAPSPPVMEASPPTTAAAPAPVEAHETQSVSDNVGSGEQVSDKAPAPAEAPAAPEPASTPAEAPIAPPEPAPQAAAAPAPAAKPAKPKKARSASNVRKSAWDANPLRSFIGKHGLSLSLANEFAPGKTERKRAMAPGYGPIFRSTGLNIDALAERAAEEGFIASRDDTTELYNKIAAVFRGERVEPLHDPHYLEQKMQAEMTERQAEQTPDADVFDIVDDPAVVDQNVDEDDLPWDHSPGEVRSSADLADDEDPFPLPKAQNEPTTQTQPTRDEAAGNAVEAPHADPQENPARADAEARPRSAAAPDAAATERASEKLDPVDLWEDNDDGKEPHVAWTQLTKDAQRTWRDAVDEGYASIKLHDELVETHKSNERKDRINAKVKRNDNEADFRHSDIDIDAINSVDELNRQVNDSLNRGGKPAEFAARRVPIGDLVGKAKWIGSVQLAARIFGRKVIYFEVTQGPAFFDGVVLGGDDTIFINVDASRPQIRIFGHEFVHSMRRTHPEAYNRLVDLLHPNLNELGMDAYRIKQARNGVTKDAKVLEEAVGDIVGDRFGESAFWTELAGRDRSAFEQVADIIKAFIDGALLKLEKTLGSERLVSDLKAARKAVVDVLSELDTGTSEQTGDGPAFSRKDGQPFYSALHRALDALPMKKGTPQAWKQTIGSFAKNNKAKQEEIDWTLVNDWLDLQQGTLAKEQVQAYLASSAPGIDRIVLSEETAGADIEDIRQTAIDHMVSDGMSYEEAEEGAMTSRSGLVDWLNRRGYRIADDGPKHDNSSLVLPGGQRYAEIVVQDKKIAPYAENDTMHFGDTARGRALGWLRVTERNDSKGEKTLFIEELQSKRAQDKRKSEKDKAEGKRVSDVPTAPFIDDTKSWVTFLLKHAVQYAHEHGIQQIAWTTGDQQAKRNSFTQFADTLYSGNNGDGTWAVSAYMGGTKVFGQDRIATEKLDGYVGADVAKRIIDSGDGMKIEGADLNTRGRSMHSFYEGIVPQAADKLLKGFGGKSETIEIEGLGAQPGFKVPASMSKVLEDDGLPMFSRKDYEAQFADLPEKVRAMAMAKGKPTPPTIKARLAALKPRAMLRLTQGVADAFRTVKDYSEKAYMMLTLSTSVDGAVEGIMHFGQVQNDDGALNVRKGTKGLIDALKPVGAEVDRFLLWIAANRARNLKRQEREKYFKDDEIAQLTRLNAGTMKDGGSRAAVYAEALRHMNDINRSVLDVARSAGLINAEAYKRFSEDIWYVPFYRQMENDRSLSAAQNSNGAVGQYLSKKLKGSDRPLNDLMENVLLNWSHILSASMKNAGAVETLKSAERAGVVEKLTKKGEFVADREGNMHKASAAVKVMEGGVESHYMIHDPMLLEALMRVEGSTQNAFVSVMRPFKTALTKFVALNPTFKINNLIRDSIQSIAVSQLDPNVFKNVTQGIRAYHKGRTEALFGGGLFTAGNAFDGDLAAGTKRLVKLGVSEAHIMDSESKLKAFLGHAWERYHEASEISENANRLALYRQLRESGASHLEAAYAARDLQDFHRQGAWGIVRTLNQILPYFNARIQGLYKLGRSSVDPAQRQRFGWVAGAVMMAAIGLYLLNKDDEDYRKLESWERDNYFHVKLPGTSHFVRIPKPFELGALASIAERVTEQFADKSVEGKVFANRLWHIVKDNLAINPMPQMLRPLWDVGANQDSFTGRQIESEALKKMSPENRVNPGTSVAGVALGTVNGMIANGIKDATGIETDAMKFSPVQYDFMLRGYLGWLGTVIQASSDIATAPLRPGESADRKIDDYFIVGNFVKSLPADQSQYVDDFYESAKAAAQVAADFQHYKQLGEIDKARDIIDSKGDELALAKVYATASQQMAKISAQIKRVQSDESMSGAEKRAEIDRLSQLRIEYAKRVEEVRKARKA